MKWGKNEEKHKNITTLWKITEKCENKKDLNNLNIGKLL